MIPPLYLPLSALLLLAALCPAADVPSAATKTRAGAPPPTPARTAEAAPPVIRDARGDQLIATCEIEGKPVNMIVDTGATHTTLDETFTRTTFPSLKAADISGPFQTNAPRPPKMTRANLLVTPLFVEKHPILLLDLSGLNDILQTRVHGVLGMNTMGCLPFIFNVRDQVFRYDANLKHAPGMKKLRGHLDESNRLVLEARAGGRSYALLLDTGASATLITQSAWQGETGESIPLDSASVKGRSTKEVLLAQPTDFEIGDGLVLHGVAPMLVGESLSNGAQTVGLLGLDSLKNVELYYFPPSPGQRRGASGFYARQLDAPEP